MPTPAQNVMAPAVTAVRSALRDPTLVRPTLTLPLGPGIDDVERSAVERLQQVLTQAQLPYFFIPSPEPSSIRLGMPSEQRGDLLRALQAHGAGLHLSWEGAWAFHTVPAAQSQRLLRRELTMMWVHQEPHAVNRSDVLDAARAVRVEFWLPDGAGLHQAVVRNPYASVVRFGAPMVTRRARTGHDLPTYPAFRTPDIGEVGFPVDAVYLWVDDADPAWRARRDDTMRSLGVEPGHESAEDARFRQHDELRYSMRSLSQFAPWIRHVYLVTDRQVPPWLDQDCPRVSVVDHRELFADRGRLPTYNSHALSSMLHHLPGLANHFLYLNDDFFFGRRTGAELWFDGNGLPRCYYTGTTADPEDLIDPSALGKARNHTFDLVKQLTGRVRRRNLQHGPYAMSKELMFDLERTLPEEFHRTWASQLRNETDFVIERLHSQVGHAWGRTFDSRGVRYRYFNVGQPETEAMLRRELLSRWADTFCLNDAEGPVSSAHRGEIIRDFLEQYYPTPSEFEIAGV